MVLVLVPLVLLQMQFPCCGCDHVLHDQQQKPAERDKCSDHGNDHWKQMIQHEPFESTCDATDCHMAFSEKLFDAPRRGVYCLAALGEVAEWSKATLC